MYRLLKIFLVNGLRILLGLCGIIIIYTIFFETRGYQFYPKPEGVKFFISCFGPYVGIFSALIAFVGIYLVVEQIELSLYANKRKSLQKWNLKYEEKLLTIRLANPNLHDHIADNSKEIFAYYSKLRFRISNRRQLRTFFKKFLANEILSFEMSTSAYISNNGAYANDDTSYSLEHVTEFLDELIEPGFHYVEYNKHFKKMYLKKVKEMRPRGI